MLRVTVIAAAVCVTACPGAIARGADAEPGPIANPAAGTVIEVPPVDQPGVAPFAGPSSPLVVAAPKPAQPAARPSSEGRPLKRPASPQVRPGVSAADSKEQDSGFFSHWFLRAAVVVGALIASLLGVRWVMRHAAAGGTLAAQLGAGGRSPQGVIEVLGRYPVSRGHSLVLLKLDRRVLLLGQSNSGFTTLCELDDPQDVASVLTRVEDDAGRALNRRFGDMLRQMERDPQVIEGETPAGVSPRAALRLRPASGGAA